jgi:O-antigen/teichoic acid export membrane protein
MVKSTGVALARNTLYSLITQIIVSIVAFFTIPALVRGLGEEGFAVLTLVWMVVGYFSILDFGVGQASVKFLAEQIAMGENEQANSTLWASAVTSASIGILVSIMLLLVTPVLVSKVLTIPPSLIEESRACFYWVTIAVPFVMVQGAFKAVPMAVQRFDLFNLMLALSGLLQWGGSLILVMAGMGLREVVYLTIAIRLVGAAVAYLIAMYLFPHLSIRIPRQVIGKVKGLLSFGGWLTISQAAGPIMRYVDRLLVAWLCSLKMFTYYVVPYEAVSRLLVIPLSLSTTLYPAMAERKSVQGTAQAITLYTRAANFTALTVLPISIILAEFSTPILQLWLGGDFPLLSGRVFTILAAAVFIQSLGYVPVTTLQAIGRPDVAPKFYLVEIPLYIVICILLIPLLGIEGAAWAWFLRIVISTGWLLWKAHRVLSHEVEISYPKSLLWVFLLNGALVVLLALIRNGIEGLPWQIGVAVVATLGYAVCAWYLCLSDQERGALKKLTIGRLGMMTE